MDFNERLDPLDMLPEPGVRVGTMPAIQIDASKKTMTVDGINIGLLKSLKMDENLIVVEKYRVYVPTFQFEHAWENFIGSDVANEDEATENYDKQKSHVFLDRKSRKPLLYTFAIDHENTLFFVSKRVEI